MPALARAHVLAGLMTCAASLAPAVAQSPPMEITTDTVEYCLRLRDKISSLMNLGTTPPSHQVLDLSSEGQRMCDQGQPKGGVMRLRKALMLMQHPEEDH